jgi:hypothetical protein
MSSLKEPEYRGSSAYGRTPAARTLVDHCVLRVSLTLAWARLQIARLLRPNDSTHTSSPRRPADKKAPTRSTPPQAVPVHRSISELFSVPNPDARPRRMRNDY